MFEAIISYVSFSLVGVPAVKFNKIRDTALLSVFELYGLRGGYFKPYQNW